jgi:hypothetical protein
MLMLLGIALVLSRAWLQTLVLPLILLWSLLRLSGMLGMLGRPGR